MRRPLLNLISNVTLQLVTAISGLILPRLILLAYGSETNGLVASVSQFLTYLALVETGIAAASMVGLYKPLVEKNIKQINAVLAATKLYYQQAGILYLILLFLFVLSYPLLVSSTFNTLTCRLLIIVLALINLTDYFVLGKYRVLLEADQRGYVLSIFQIFAVVLRLIVSIVLIDIGYDIVAVMAVSTFVYILRVVAIISYVRRAYPLLNFNVKPNTGALSERWGALVHQISGVVLNNSNVVILTLCLTGSVLSEISVYFIYASVVTIGTALCNAIASALVPFVARILRSHSKEDVYQIYSVIEFWYLIIFSIFSASLFVLYVPFIELYTHGVSDTNYVRYEVGYLFTLIFFLQNLRIPGLIFIAARGDFRKTQNRAILEALINLVLAIPLVLISGLQGALIATIVAFIFSTYHVFWYVNRFVLNNLAQTVKRIFRSLILISICIGVGEWLLQVFLEPSFINWIICGVLLVLISLPIHLLGNFFFESNQYKQLTKLILHKNEQ